MRETSMRKPETVLLAIGIAFLCIFLAFRIHSAIASREALHQFASERVLLSEGKGGSTFSEAQAVDSSQWSEKRIKAYKQSLAVPVDAPIAVLTIRKISLEVPVFDGTDELVLNRGVGRIIGTSKPGKGGNIGIAGHRDGFFRGLKDIQPGDRIELATLDSTIVYVVDSIKIVLPEDISVLESRERPSITLVTCYPFYFVGNAPKRYIVHASISEPDALSDRKPKSDLKITNKKEIKQ